MRKVKFNRIERIAGLFVVAAVAGVFVITVLIAIKQGWFENKVKYVVEMPSADGVREGTLIQMAGLKIGSVQSIELRGSELVIVGLSVSEAYKEKIRSDSIVRVSRPFIIGEKVFDISLGSQQSPEMPEGAQLAVEMAPDLLDFVSGKSLGPHLKNLSRIAESLRVVAETLFDPRRTKAFVQMIDDIAPLVQSGRSVTKEANVLLQDLNKGKRIVGALDDLRLLTGELNRTLPLFAKDSPQLAQDVSKIARNMAVLTDEMQKAIPAFAKIGPELPRASLRAIEALDETVVTLKALQKSFLLRGNVRDVREEEAKLIPIRLPAQSDQK
jgi:phospholipid/cholesterol/gamma-HCH transport system substrate-binding protein